MPNRYEREIEEILRNLEQTEPKGARSGRSRPKSERRMSTPRRRVPSFELHFGAAEWCLFMCVATALLAGGIAYALREATIYTGVLAIVSLVFLLIVVLLPFFSRGRASRGATRYSNVSRIRRNPLSSLATRWNLFILKLRYRRKRDL